MKIFSAIIGFVIVAILAVFISHMNTIPTYDENIKASFAQLQNQYKRRAELIPNLIATVKGYAKHEDEVFTKITNARAKVNQINIDEKLLNDPKLFEKFEKSQNQLTQALSKLMMVSERYPNLKSNKNFLALQTQLEGTQNRISVAIKDYIKQVKLYNIELRTIPGKWVASVLYPNAKAKPTFTISKDEQKNPVVKF